MPEANNRPPETQKFKEVMEAAGLLVRTSLELQSWSGHLDWSKRLAAEGALKTPELIDAFSEVKRIDFLPDEQKADNGYDKPIPIGYGQSNSQPSLVAQMLELLDVKEGQSVLDVGTGSGWTTGLVASVVKSEGQVIGVERIPELVDFSSANLFPYGFSWAKVELAGPELGFPEEAPYDRILVSAHMLEEWMPELSSQLSPDGGTMIAPVAAPANHGSKDYDQSIVVVTRNGDEVNSETICSGVSFVPLMRDEAEA